MEQTEEVFEQPRKWVTLIEGVRELIRRKKDGERLASLITHRTWDLYSHPRTLAAKGQEGRKLFILARWAFRNTTKQLKKELSQAKIRGEGFHEDSGQRGPITESEWGNRLIDFWQNRLLNKRHQNGKQYPCITAVEINLDDLLRSRQSSPPPLRRSGAAKGAKPKYDWPDVEDKVCQLMDKEGDFRPWDSEWKCQAELEHAVAKYLKRRHLHPAESTIRKRLGPMIDRWRQRQLKADN
jgi:hypothetical protein